MSDSKKNKVITVRLTEEAYKAADERRAERGHKFQWLLETFLESYTANAQGVVPPSTNKAPLSLPNLDEQLIISLESVAQQLSAASADMSDVLVRIKQERKQRAQQNPKEEVDGKPVTDNAPASGEWAVVERVQETVAKLSRRPAGNRKGSLGNPGYAGTTAGGDGKPRKTGH